MPVTFPFFIFANNEMTKFISLIIKFIISLFTYLVNRFIQIKVLYFYIKIMNLNYSIKVSVGDELKELFISCSKVIPSKKLSISLSKVSHILHAVLH